MSPPPPQQRRWRWESLLSVWKQFRLNARAQRPRRQTGLCVCLKTLPFKCLRAVVAAASGPSVRLTTRPFKYCRTKTTTSNRPSVWRDFGLNALAQPHQRALCHLGLAVNNISLRKNKTLNFVIFNVVFSAHWSPFLYSCCNALLSHSFKNIVIV